MVKSNSMKNEKGILYAIDVETKKLIDGRNVLEHVDNRFPEK